MTTPTPDPISADSYKVTNCTFVADESGNVTGGFTVPTILENSVYSLADWYLKTTFLTTGGASESRIANAAITSGNNRTFAVNPLVGTPFVPGNAYTFQICSYVNHVGAALEKVYAEEVTLTPLLFPSIDQIDPVSGTEFGGFDITITGTRMQDVTGIQIGGVDYRSRTKGGVQHSPLVVTAKASSVGAKDVTITTRHNGAVTKIGGFLYVASDITQAEEDALKQAVLQASAAVTACNMAPLDPDNPLTADELSMLADLKPQADNVLATAQRALLESQKLTHAPPLPRPAPSTQAARSAVATLAAADPVLDPLNNAQLNALLDAILSGTTYPSMP